MMNKKKIIIAGLFLVCAVVSYAVWNVNVNSGIPGKEIYAMESLVTLNGYEYQVRECKLIEPSEFPDGVRKDGLEAILAVKVFLRSTEGNKSVSGANLMVQTDIWGNSMDLDSFFIFNDDVINSGWNRKIDENGVELWIPFHMNAVQVGEFDMEEMKSKQYELVISLTPFCSIMLNPESE